MFVENIRAGFGSTFPPWNRRFVPASVNRKHDAKVVRFDYWWEEGFGSWKFALVSLK